MPDSGSEPTAPRWLDSLHRLGATLLATLRNRAELLAVELQEEKQRFVITLAWFAATVFFCVTAALLLTLTVVFLCPSPWRPCVLAGFCVLYCGLAIWAVFNLRKLVRHRPLPLEGTVAELKKDVECLRSKT